MRAPRYRFPEEVRSATRTIATQMTRDGTVATTPEELDAWLARAPEIRAVYEQGGYGTAFTAADVLPLLEVFVAQRETPTPRAAAKRRRIAVRWWVLLAFAAVAAALLLVSVALAARA